MKTPSIFVIATLLSLTGCFLFPREESFYVSVTMQNQSPIRITGVSVGSGKNCNRFGLLGSKGAGKGAIIPICFASRFHVQWEEGPDDQQHHANVDLRSLAGSNYITLTYQGNDVWIAKRDEPIQTTNTVSNLPPNK